jgi:hypothetical protein
MRARPLTAAVRTSAAIEPWSARLALRLSLVAVIVALGTTSGVGRALQSPGAGAFAPVGTQSTRGYFSQLPFESVDMVNGNLTLTFTDLVLPGNAGMDLRITRTYRHQRGPGELAWTISFTDVPIAVNLHSDPQYPALFKPGLVMADRSTKKLHENVVAGYWITSNFWRYDATARTLHLPDGRVATYQQTGDPWGGIHLDHIEDPYGNRITPHWVGFPIYTVDYVEQPVAGTNESQTRTVDFSWNSPNPNPIVTYDGKHWTYTDTSAEPPLGPAWEYSLSGFDNEQDLSGTMTVTLPTGGTVAYEFIGEEGRSHGWPPIGCVGRSFTRCSLS